MSDKRPETDADIVSRSTELSYDFATGGQYGSRRYHHDLVGHMAECDMNFLRLMQLFPNVREADFRCVMLFPGSSGARVELNVLKRGPYTTLLQLTQVPKQDWGSSPNMKIQLYHDTKSAEVVAYQHQSRFHGAYEYPNKRMRARDEKEQLNRFLGEYLALCLAVGMSPDALGPESQPSAAPLHSSQSGDEA
ncbi:MAG: cytoplasmic protein [Gammaproteobacteria bacterium]|nr:cytoplasmic protein [Gammaproteobacteria bacterium]